MVFPSCVRDQVPGIQHGNDEIIKVTTCLTCRLSIAVKFQEPPYQILSPGKGALNAIGPIPLLPYT